MTLNSSGRTTSTTASSSTCSFSRDASSSNAEDYNQIGCEICFEPFHSTKRPPKLLPCGHNFCERCIYSLCCHQQYYLLDSIKCPVCRAEFNTSAALAAPTNYDLCEMLKTVRQQHSGNSTDISNITVIHVPESSGTTSKSIKLRSWPSGSRQRFGSRRRRSMYCTDCSRKLAEKKRRKEARFCRQCFSFSKDDCLRIACLECCVNRHNGHQLVTLSELEHEHSKVISDLHCLQQSIQTTNKQVEAGLKNLTENSVMSQNDCDALRRAKQTLLAECKADLKFALSVLENDDTTPLPPMVLQRMRQHQYHNSARLHKLLHFIEKCDESTNERFKLKTSMPHSSPFSLTASAISKRQPRATALQSSALDDRSAIKAITAVLAVVASGGQSDCPIGNGTKTIEEALKVLNRNTSTKADRRAAMVCCAKQLRSFIDETICKQSLVLYIDAYLHIFYQLNLLVTRFPHDDDSREASVCVPVTRWDVWKLVQLVYTDLMRCAAKHWNSEESERVDLTDDLAFLCSLYSDVSDEATITICMIEAARARAAAASSTATAEAKKVDEFQDNERRTLDIRLNLIDEHLLECRRVQKLQQLRVATASKRRRCTSNRSELLRRIWKRFSTCFSRSSVMQH